MWCSQAMMRKSLSVTLSLAAAISAGLFAQTNQPNTTAPKPSQAGPTQSGYVLKVRTRLVTLDVIATDAQGNAVRDLKPEELQILEERNKEQKISAFDFVDMIGKPSAAPLPASSNVYSNAVDIEN